MTTLDERDTEILKSRQAAFLARTEPKQGDFIRFACGTIKRIAHVWTEENGQAFHIQPTAGNGDTSFYMGDGYMSFSGSLDSGMDASKFTRTNETMVGWAWFFHHDYAVRDGGVHVRVECPVWECSEPAEK